MLTASIPLLVNLSLRNWYHEQYVESKQHQAENKDKDVWLQHQNIWLRNLENNQRIHKKLQVFIYMGLRRILNLKWTDKIRNETLWERTKQTPIENEIRKKEMAITKPEKFHHLADPQRKRPSGSAKITWWGDAVAKMERGGNQWHQLEKITQGRRRWNGVLGDLCFPWS